MMVEFFGSFLSVEMSKTISGFATHSDITDGVVEEHDENKESAGNNKIAKR